MMSERRTAMLAKIDALHEEQRKAVEAGGKYIQRHRDRGKLTARERIELLLDEGSAFLELQPLIGWGSDFALGGSMVTGIGVVEGVECMIVASDPTVIVTTVRSTPSTVSVVVVIVALNSAVLRPLT